MDDVVVKTSNLEMLIEDLRETFDSLRKVHLMLNPEKCTFGVPSGKLLSFLVSHRGIEANRQNQGYQGDAATSEDQGHAAPQRVHHHTRVHHLEAG